MIKKADWLALAKDRAAILLFVGLGMSCLVIIITIILRLHPSDIQVPVRYTGFGQTFIYRDQWYTLYSYVGLAVIVTAVNGFLALRLYQIRRLLSLGLLGMTIFVVVLATIVINAMFNLAPSL